jgi:hypothetical protein
VRTEALKLFMVVTGVAMFSATLPLEAQTSPPGRRTTVQTSATDLDPVAVLGCSRPAEAKEAKVIAFDGNSVAKLAVSLGSGRFKLVTIKTWERPEDARPLNPVVEAARVTQDKVHFSSPHLNADPETAHDTYLLMVEMGGDHVCWATSKSLINDASRQPSAEIKPDSAPAPTEGAAPPSSTRTRQSTVPRG